MGARGAASRCGNGLQRRALSGPNRLSYFPVPGALLLGETCLLSLGQQLDELRYAMQRPATQSCIKLCLGGSEIQHLY